MKKIIVKYKAKEFVFPIGDPKKPIQLRLYKTPEGEVTTMLQTDHMVAHNIAPKPIMLYDFPSVAHRLADKLERMRNGN